MGEERQIIGLICLACDKKFACKGGGLCPEAALQQSENGTGSEWLKDIHLSRMEWKTVTLLMKGKTLVQIAKALKITRVYLRNIKARLHSKAKKVYLNRAIVENNEVVSAFEAWKSQLIEKYTHSKSSRKGWKNLSDGNYLRVGSFKEEDKELGKADRRHQDFYKKSSINGD